jgi:hypothetical protein
VSREESWRKCRHRVSKIREIRLVEQAILPKRAVVDTGPVWQLLRDGQYAISISLS